MSATKTRPSRTKQWLLREKPYGLPLLGGENPTFILKDGEVPYLQKGEVLLKTLYLSNDPAQRSWISPLSDPARLYLPPVQEGEVMKCMGIGEVVESLDPKLTEGTLVTGFPGWSEYSVAKGSDLSRFDVPDGLSPTHFLGALGLPGFTAYYALTQIVKATKNDAVVVSGAAGAVGNIAVQLAKHFIGCRKVIGIAGTDEKCAWVKKLGADVCLNYKKPSFYEDLTVATEGFVEVYFDNVGGEILDFMFTRMAKFGRIAASGTIADYNKDDSMTGLKNFYQVVTMRIQVMGFINIDWLDHLKEVVDILVKEWKEGRLVIEGGETIVRTRFENIPETWLMLYSGGNTGKLVTELIYN